MRVSDEKRFVFVHIPKTGGATMEKILDRAIPDVRFEERRKHDTLGDILELEPHLADYWVFGFVRNPWARMVSWWSMIHEAKRQADAGNEWKQWQIAHYPLWRATKDYSFEEFLTRGADEVERIRRPQLDFLRVPGRDPDFVGRTENILEDVNQVRRRLGLRPRPKLPHAHRGSHGPYRDYYTPVLRDRVTQLFKVDIDEFGYEF